MQNQKGVSLIITFFLMVILLGVVITVSTLLYIQIKVIRNMSSSIVAFYAADSGATEKMLYYEKEVFPDSTVYTSPNVSKRGLCSMCSYDPNHNQNACRNTPNNPDPSMDCNNCQVFDLSSGSPVQLGVTNNIPLSSLTGGCNPNDCSNCQIIFTTNYSGNTAVQKEYDVTATVTPYVPSPTTQVMIDIKAKGFYNKQSISNSASRQIDIPYGPLPRYAD